MGEPTPSRPTEPLELLRVSVGAGAQFLRSYDVGFQTLNDSDLSHTLSPLGLFSADIEATLPDIPVFGRVVTSLRPVNYSLEVQNAEPVEDARGLFVNVTGLVGYSIGLGGDSRSNVRILPAAGLRLAVSSVPERIREAVLSSTSLGAVGGVTLRWPVNEMLEIDIGVDGGYVFSYSESPNQTGNGGAGFVVGADVGAQVWLTDSFGIMIDNRFVYESIGLDGAPNRTVPESEGQGTLSDGSVTTQDLLTSIGVVFRL